MQAQGRHKRGKPFPFHIIVFLAPAVIIYTAFMIYPLLDSLRLSLFAPTDTSELAFVGLSNYQRLLTDYPNSPYRADARQKVPLS